jgi:serine protease Do
VLSGACCSALPRQLVRAVFSPVSFSSARMSRVGYNTKLEILLSDPRGERWLQPMKLVQNRIRIALSHALCMWAAGSVPALPLFAQAPPLAANPAADSPGEGGPQEQGGGPQEAGGNPQPAAAAAASVPGLADVGGLAAALEQATIAAIEKAEQSVVAIARVRRDQVPLARADQLLVPNPLLLPDSPASADFIPSEFASGVVISSDGLIVTCAHVLDDPRRHDYYVWLNKRMFRAQVMAQPAKVLAADPYTDLAVLKIEAADLQPMTWGDASRLRKGSFVLALGNPYAIARDGHVSASWGIVSNLQRVAPAADRSENAGPLAKENQHQFGTLIQTDARLHFGTSGGALINLNGEMVGLTTSLAALSGYEQPAGFAIAVDAMFQRVVDTLRTGHLPEFGFLGIQPEELQSHEKAAGLKGARVSVVVPGLPGDEAGLRADDRIVEINRDPVVDRNGLFRQLSQLPAGAEVELLVHRPRRGYADFVPLQLRARLSKKYVATARPAYALNQPGKWRGMLVEYATAMPSELMRGGLQARRAPAKLAILAVDPDSPAWGAGLRAGQGLLAMDGVQLESPQDFYTRAAEASGTVQLQIARVGERPEVVSVAEAAQAAD